MHAPIGAYHAPHKKILDILGAGGPPPEVVEFEPTTTIRYQTYSSEAWEPGARRPVAVGSFVPTDRGQPARSVESTTGAESDPARALLSAGARGESPMAQYATRAARPDVLHRRSPGRVALWSLLTLSVYGFWWWWDLHRQLRALGRPARPWRALGLVTLGWVLVAPAVMAGWFWLAVGLTVVPAAMSLLAVRESALMLAEAERASGVAGAVSVPMAVGLAAAALAGLMGWFALTAAAAVEGGMALGFVWPALAMGLVVYLQAGLNQALVADGSPR